MNTSPKLLHSATRLISIVREGKELLALLNQPKEPPDHSENEPEIPWGNFFEFRTVPLGQLPKSIHPLSAHLILAWDRVSRAQYVDQVTVEHILTILLHSVPASNTTALHLPALELPKKEKIFSPTAARPRASKGTKDRPPKPPQPEPTDLRPYLTSCDGTQRVLRHFQALLPKTLPSFAKKGYLPFALIKTMKTADLIPFLTLPGLHKRSLKEELGRLPPLFIQHLLPGMRLRPTREIRELLSIFYTMNLEDHEALLAAVSRFVCLKENPHLLPWCTVLIQQPPETRSAFLVHVMAHGCHLHIPTSALKESLKEVNSLVTDDNYDLWITRLLRAWKEGISLEYLLAGFRLAKQFSPHYRFYSIRDCSNFPEELIEDLACYFPSKPHSSHGYRIMRLWERSGELPEFTSVLRNISWYSHSPETAYRLAATILDICWFYENHRHFHQKWSALKEEILTIEQLLHTMPKEFHQRALDEIRGVAQQYEELVPLRTRLKRLYPLIRRICQSPYDPTIDASALNGVFVSTKSQRLVTRFLQAPDGSFHAMDDVARRDNVERLVTYGLYSLINTLPEFTVQCFQNFPRHLFKTCKALGCLSHPARLRLLHNLEDHTFFTNELEHYPVQEACQKILEVCGTDLWNPVPHYLARWTRGEYRLTSKRIARYFQICFEHLDRTRLALVEQRALEILSRGLPKVPLQGAARHAVQLFGSMDQNKRELRRFLNAYWSGNGQYLEHHPATQLWLKKHPRVHLAKWKKGIHLKGTIKGKTIQLQIEDDPLEILKIGTYVGSCLSLGGAYSESAAAVLLDINKQVIYARDTESVVVGRQLVAISENDELVCFDVYPHNVNPEMIALFWKFDMTLSKFLKLKVYQPPEKENEEENYVVEEILSEYWWDDGAWNLHLPRKARKVKKSVGILIHP